MHGLQVPLNDRLSFRRLTISFGWVDAGRAFILQVDSGGKCSMPHIPLPEGLFGIRSAMAFRPETAKPLNELVEVLLRGPSTLSPGERELIATYVSSLNECYYCQTIHGAIAAANLDGDEELVRKVKADFAHADVSDKLKALLVIAGKVQRDGKSVTGANVERARAAGATDLEIHDTVLIAAAFCMYNRYVDGLATVQPHDEEMYRERGKIVAREGYINVSKTYLPVETVSR
jgi:uncharacterized peroxidase-related enzyme